MPIDSSLHNIMQYLTEPSTLIGIGGALPPHAQELGQKQAAVSHAMIEELLDGRVERIRLFEVRQMTRLGNRDQR